MSLVNGEVAIVLRRGATVMTPLVASLANNLGKALAEPLLRDTSAHGQSVVCVVADRKVSVRVAPEKLLALAEA